MALVAALALSGCKAGPSSSGATGTVVDRAKVKNYGKSWRDHHWTVTVQEDGGKRDKGRVSESVYEACQLGDRWPDCKEDAR